jgi:ureidoglycolate dehydrogenase (NAD+)
MSAAESTRQILPVPLEEFVRATLQAAGVPAPDAATVAECLVCANLSGFDSHGVVRLGHYLRRIEGGTISTRPRIGWSRPAPSVGIVDGDNGLGHVVTRAACAHAMEIVRETGMASVAIRNSSHFGMAGYYILGLVGQGAAALLTTATDAFLVPHGGSRPFFGTNPVAIGFPAPDIPVVLDMATTSIPYGKLALAQREGRSVPADWGVDDQGKPCTDPARIRGLHPIAGPKGSGLAMVVDILSNLLSGMAFGPHITGMYTEMDRTRGLGHFLTVWDVGRFQPIEEFTRRIGEMIDELRQVPPATGHERVYYPGEIEGLTRRRRSAEGIPIEPGLYAELESIGAARGIPFPPGVPSAR